jgi:hypothetical protein
MGIEPTSEAWEASILPLYDARSFSIVVTIAMREQLVFEWRVHDSLIVMSGKPFEITSHRGFSFRRGSQLSVRATAQIEWLGIKSIHGEPAEFGTSQVSTHVSYRISLSAI